MIMREAPIAYRGQTAFSKHPAAHDWLFDDDQRDCSQIITLPEITSVLVTYAHLPRQLIAARTRAAGCLLGSCLGPRIPLAALQQIIMLVTSSLVNLLL